MSSEDGYARATGVGKFIVGQCNLCVEGFIAFFGLDCVVERFDAEPCQRRRVVEDYARRITRSADDEPSLRRFSSGEKLLREL